jgi:hypothetical protein
MEETMKLVRLCEHDRYLPHWLPPENITRLPPAPGADDRYVRCEGGTPFEIDWAAAYRAGEWMDDANISDFEKAVEDIVNAALQDD